MMDVSWVELSPKALMLVPIVMAMVSFMKLYVDSKWAPLFSLAFGILMSLLIPALTFGLTIVQGIVVGLMACGLYSGAKAVYTQ